MFCAIISLTGLLIAATGAGLLSYFLETQLSNTLLAVVAMRVFVRPDKPKFDYSDKKDDSSKSMPSAPKSFKDIQFIRAKFFENSSGFAKKLSTALIECARGRTQTLRNMLEKPDEWMTVANILMMDPEAGMFIVTSQGKL